MAVSFQDRELFPAGNYTNQSSGGQGIKSWVERDDKVDNEDIVIWHTYTFTHNPRPEDFPIMRE
jgi:primary-amine oxidase